MNCCTRTDKVSFSTKKLRMIRNSFTCLFHCATIMQFWVVPKSKEIYNGSSGVQSLSARQSNVLPCDRLVA